MPSGAARGGIALVVRIEGWEALLRMWSAQCKLDTSGRLEMKLTSARKIEHGEARDEVDECERDVICDESD